MGLTQDVYKRQLLYQLKRSMACAEQIDIIVSFLMESGVRLLLADLKQALDRGVKIRILTGNYLGITQPGAVSYTHLDVYKRQLHTCSIPDRHISSIPRCGNW